jgi:hypothetical protein
MFKTFLALTARDHSSTATVQHMFHSFFRFVFDPTSISTINDSFHATFLIMFPPQSYWHVFFALLAQVRHCFHAFVLVGTDLTHRNPNLTQLTLKRFLFAIVKVCKIIHGKNFMAVGTSYTGTFTQGTFMGLQLTQLHDLATSQSTRDQTSGFLQTQQQCTSIATLF